MGSKRTYITDVITVILLLFGWVIAIIGGFVGLVLLWTSKTWSRRDKVIGTMIPVEYALAYLILILAQGNTSCSSVKPCVSSGPSAGDILLLVLFVAMLAAVLVSTVHLVRRIRYRPV